jgi:acetoin utilization deacetylase AcuC-like enzyme
MQVFSNHRFSVDLPPGHRFPMPKYQLLRDRVETECSGLRLAEAEQATDGELALVHTPSYVTAVSDGTLSAAAQREIGFPWSERMVTRSRRSVGASIAAARAALSEGVACHLAGGTHHAYADRGSGYCVFNDVAVAARWAQAHRAVRQVLVIDLDVHQGNGTAAIFAGDPTVFTLSLHGAKNFPFRKVAGDLDVDLPDACGDDAYLQALDQALAALDTRLHEAPGLVFYLAGADPHAGDRLGRLGLSSAAMAARDARVFDWLRAHPAPVVMLMAGGYPTDLEALLDVQQASAVAAWRLWVEWNNGRLPVD